MEQRSCLFGFRVLAAETTETFLLGYLPHVQQVGTFLMMCFEGQIGWILRKSNSFLGLVANPILSFGYHLEP